MGLKQHLLDVSAAYSGAVGLSESRVSTLVFRAGHRIPNLRKGSDAKSGTLEAGLQWFSDNWPEGVPWPCDVLRPAPTPSAPTALSVAA